MHAGGIEARPRSQAAQDEEGAGPRQRTALRVEEELWTTPAIEERPAAGEVSAHRLDALAAERDDPLLVSFAEAPHDPVLQVDAPAVEPHRLADAQAGPVEELDERTVTERARRRPVRGLNQPLDFSRGQRAREASAAARKVELGRGVVLTPAE